MLLFNNVAIFLQNKEKKKNILHVFFFRTMLTIIFVFVVGLLIGYVIAPDYPKNKKKNNNNWCFICDQKKTFCCGHGNQLYECAVCFCKFFRPEDYQEHMKTHGDRPYKCCICTSEFKEKGVFELHQEYAHIPIVYNCKTCGKEFQNPYLFDAHFHKNLMRACERSN